VKLNCKSCGQGHFIPDERVAAAGTRGLRVRCKGCRAVMAVDGMIKQEVGEDTSPDLPRLRRTPRAATSEPELTGLRRIDEEPVPIPAMMEGERISSLPGVTRSVTGVTLPRPKLLKKKRDPRMWFAAIDGRPRGPYSRAEIEALAELGHIRGRTRMWRPGFKGWVRVRTGNDESEALGWVRDIVIARKRAEREAVERARAELGVNMIELSAPRQERPMEALPPPLPIDAALEQLPAAYAHPFDEPHEVFRSPTPVLAPLREEWSPSEHHAAFGARRRKRRWLLTALAVVLVAVVSFYTVPALLSLGSL
jgi:hypothetical protein